MNGYIVNYLYYEKSKRSIITIPRAIIDAGSLSWSHKDEIKIIIKEIDGQKGLFLWKRKKTLPEFEIDKQEDEKNLFSFKKENEK